MIFKLAQVFHDRYNDLLWVQQINGLIYKYEIAILIHIGLNIDLIPPSITFT